MLLAKPMQTRPEIETRPLAYAPVIPSSIEDTQLPAGFLAQLACKILFHAGPQRVSDLAARIKLPASIVESVIDFLRRERLCEVTSTSTGMSLVFALTDLGRVRAEEYLRISQYAGPAPVSHDAYVRQVRLQTVADIAITRTDVEHAYSGIVIRRAITDRLGAAMNSGRALFVYGPSGAGKTFVVEQLSKLLAGAVFVPHAVLVGDHVVQVFDALVHERVTAAAEDAVPLLRRNTCDQRWVLCRRPMVLAGGELTLDMLDLRFDPGTRFYSAPPQLKANNGLFVVDDLGRQLVKPQDLMNRWIVPLDRRVDYLALHTGEKFLVPFDVIVVFSTNLDPAELADEAFLRRLGYKIHVGPIDAREYREICRQVCASLSLRYSDAAVDYLLARFEREGRALLPCTPRDLLGQVRDQMRYTGIAPELTPDLLSWAWDNYFVAADVEPFEGAPP